MGDRNGLFDFLSHDVVLEKLDGPLKPNLCHNSPPGRRIFTISEDGEKYCLSGQACFETVPDGKQVRE